MRNGAELQGFGVALLSQRVPVVVTTHSAEVLNNLQFLVGRTFEVSMRDGVASIPPIGSGSRASLDEFTAMGHVDQASLPPRAGATATGLPHRILSGSTNG